MINKLSAIEGSGYNPYHNLAMESLLLERVAEDEVILYLWQNQNTVVIGKNQNAWKECNTTKLENDGGFLARRLSGGGAVFHDLGNVNFTFVSQKANYDVDKENEVILRALLKLGIAAEKTGRNDITVDGKKISGHAFYEHLGRCYHHGTLMLNVEIDALGKYLNVSPDKLKSKGVSSVRARVTNLLEHAPGLTVDGLKQALYSAFAEVYEHDLYFMSAEELDQERLAQHEAQYADWDWRYGRKFDFEQMLENRFPWGRVEFCVKVSEGIITDAQLYSDALIPDFIDQITPLLMGCRYEGATLAQAVCNVATETDAEHAAQAELAQWLEQTEL